MGASSAVLTRDMMQPKANEPYKNKYKISHVVIT